MSDKTAVTRRAQRGAPMVAAVVCAALSRRGDAWLISWVAGEL
ncbi:hypothetical protein [Actinomadura alba]|nr:hypothetical protein [Actinomadura alba]